MPTRNAFKLILLFAFGVLIGGLTVEIAHRKDGTKVLFARKQKCETLAEAYAETNFGLTLNKGRPFGTTATVDNVDYSPGRNSCVAIINVTSIGAGKSMRMEEVIDVLTKQTIISEPAPVEAPDINSEEGKMFAQWQQKVDEAFQKSLRPSRQQ